MGIGTGNGEYFDNEVAAVMSQVDRAPLQITVTKAEPAVGRRLTDPYDETPPILYDELKQREESMEIQEMKSGGYWEDRWNEKMAAPPARTDSGEVYNPFPEYGLIGSVFEGLEQRERLRDPATRAAVRQANAVRPFAGGRNTHIQPTPPQEPLRFYDPEERMALEGIQGTGSEWVDAGNLNVPAEEAREAAAKTLKRQAKPQADLAPRSKRQEGPITKIHEALGNVPIDTIKKMKNFTEGVMQMRPGESFEDYPELATAGASIAFDLMGVGMSTMPYKAGLGMFGGRMSPQTKNMAEHLEARGASKSTIKEMTGMERGAEGKWRFEIDDSAAKIDPTLFVQAGKSLTGEIETTVGQVLKHDELYKKYPEAADIPLIIDALHPSYGTYKHRQGIIVMDYKQKLIGEGRLGTLLHEIQHWIQHKEGFSFAATGTLPEKLRDQLAGKFIRENLQEEVRAVESLQKAAKKYIEKKRPEIARAFMEKAEEAAKKLIKTARYRTYFQNATETEAKNVENRLKFSKELRRKILAKETEDFPRSQQIVPTEFNTGAHQLGSPHDPIKPYSKDERVQSAAIKLKDGSIYTGESHFDVIMKHDLTDEQLKDSIDVFVTNAGRTISRQQALNIAKHHKQIPKGTASERLDALMSEDLMGLERMK